MLYVSSRKHWCCAIEDSKDATFSQELVIALAYAQWVFAHMALLLGLDDILRNRQGPTNHSCAATGVQNPGHVGSLLLFRREVRRVDQLFSPALQENVRREVDRGRRDISPCGSPKSSIESLKALLLENSSGFPRDIKLTLFRRLCSAFEQI